ncbi:MAG: MFS transporter [Rhodoferax sp.]|nr:MFS transporter [Rhodoferax sp.]
MKHLTPILPSTVVAAATRAMALLGAAVFVVSLGYGAGLPLLQLYLTQYLGSANPQQVAWHVGMLGGAYSFALFLFAPWWGRLSDRHGRTVVLMAGFAAFLVGGAVAALAPNLSIVYAARLLAGAGAAAILPTAQAYIADISTPVDRSRRFVLLGSAAFIGFFAGPAFGTWLAGPVMGVSVGQMTSMVNWPALVIAVGGIPILLLVPWSLGRDRSTAELPTTPPVTVQRRRFVLASMVLALLASFAVGTFEVGFNLFGGQTLGLTNGTMAIMFVTCSVAMLVAQSMMLLPAVRRRIDQRWVAATFVASALALSFTAMVSDAGALGLLIAVVPTGVGMIGPVLSYELLERDASGRGALLGRQAAAGNLGQALGSVSAGSLFALHPAAPFWLAAIVLLFGAGAAYALWGTARDDEISLQNLWEVEYDA